MSCLHILLPVYNDWASAKALIPEVTQSLTEVGCKAVFLVVDDGSHDKSPSVWRDIDSPDCQIRLLRLRRNLGHQRAICIGLCYLYKETDCAAVVVMDSDGEDDPRDVPALVRSLSLDSAEPTAVFAERARRSEGFIFVGFYHVYRFLHFLLVGHRIRVGNFSVINRAGLESLCATPELWNHYAASVYSSRIKKAFVPSARAKRIFGSSKMNFPSLVLHGLSALSVFSDRISVRMLIACALFDSLAVIGMLSVVAIRLATGYAIPGWATLAFGILAILLVQVTTFMFTFAFLVLVSRGVAPYIPIRDYHWFISRVEECK